jgi:hypothetical protein
MTAPLPVSLLVNVGVTLTPQAAQSQSLNSLLVLGSSTVIDTVERLRTYPGIDAVAADFGTSAPEYLAAVLWFEQAPQPTDLLIGRWVQSASNGELICGALGNSALAALKAVTSGGFTVTVDGGSAQHLSGLNFSAIGNFNAAAAIISAALTGATCTYSASQNQFVFTSATTGTSSTISFLSAPSLGTDISGLINGTNVSGNGAYEAPGLAAETALSAVELFDLLYGTEWYGVTVAGAVDADHLAIAPYIEAASSPIHTYWVSTQEAGVLSPTSTTDIAAELSALKYSRSGGQYSSSNPYSACSLTGRALTVDYTGNNTAIVLAYKQEPGIVPEIISATQLGALQSKSCNAFLAFNNNTAIIWQGRMFSGIPIDVRTAVDNLSIDIQTAVFNLLYTSPTKVPQTDSGNHQVVTAIEAVLSKYVQNGVLAPGQWNAAGFGSLQQGQWLSAGFYCYAPPIAGQSQADRAARKSVTFQIAAKLAGAIETVKIALVVNQ